MYIESVSIKNFKAIDEIEIDFRPGVNLLIGDNGVGKTSILEAITVALGGFLTGIPGVSSKNILADDVRICLTELGQASSAIQYKTPVEVECHVDIDGNKYQWVRKRKDELQNSKTLIENKDIVKYAQEITNDLSASLPLLCFQSEARVWQTRRSDFGTELKKKLNDRRCGYIGCLDYSLDIKGIKEWCLKMELAAFQQNMKIGEYEAFKSIVATVMQKMSDLEEKPVISYSRQVGDIVYSENNKNMPISNLSAGYQSLLWMTMNLSYRLALLNPTAGDDMAKIPGVVLIDELDMHLHPKWQWNVVRALEETFPNIQFIVATHSPIIISSCKNENLILIDEEQEIKYLPNAYGYSVEDVLELRQGSTAKPKAVEDLRDKFERAINRDDYTEAKNVVAMMRELLGEMHSEVQRAQDELELVDWGELSMLYIKKLYPLPDVIDQINKIKRSDEWREIPEGDAAAIRAQFNSIPKNSLRRILIKEQHGLCAYCMKRIRDDDKMTIEHCCDASKDEDEIQISPWNESHMKDIAYKSNGTIYTLSGNVDFEEDINERLCLNGFKDKKGNVIDTSTEIVKGRRDAVQWCNDFYRILDRKRKCTSLMGKKKIDEIEQAEIMPEYAGVKLFYLKKKYRELIQRGK